MTTRQPRHLRLADGFSRPRTIHGDILGPAKGAAREPCQSAGTTGNDRILIRPPRNDTTAPVPIGLGSDYLRHEPCSSKYCSRFVSQAARAIQWEGSRTCRRRVEARFLRNMMVSLSCWCLRPRCMRRPRTGSLAGSRLLGRCPRSSNSFSLTPPDPSNLNMTG